MTMSLIINSRCSTAIYSIQLSYMFKAKSNYPYARSAESPLNAKNEEKICAGTFKSLYLQRKH